MISAAAWMSPTFAMIVAFPAPADVTTPSGETVATRSSEELQAIGSETFWSFEFLTVAASGSGEPGGPTRQAETGEISTELHVHDLDRDLRRQIVERGRHRGLARALGREAAARVHLDDVALRGRPVGRRRALDRPAFLVEDARGQPLRRSIP